MAVPARGSGVPGAPWRACQAASLASGTGRVFVVDGDHRVTSITFSLATSALAHDDTVVITAENTLIYSGIPILMLQNPMSASILAPGALSVVVWVPPRPIAFNPNWPISIVHTAAGAEACWVRLEGYEAA